MKTNQSHAQKLNATIGTLTNELERYKSHTENFQEKFAKREDQLLELTSENADMKSKLGKFNEMAKNFDKLKGEKEFLVEAVEKLMKELEVERAKPKIVEDVVETF